MILLNSALISFKYFNGRQQYTKLRWFVTRDGCSGWRYASEVFRAPSGDEAPGIALNTVHTWCCLVCSNTTLTTTAAWHTAIITPAPPDTPQSAHQPGLTHRSLHTSPARHTAVCTPQPARIIPQLPFTLPRISRVTDDFLTTDLKLPQHFTPVTELPTGAIGRSPCGTVNTVEQSPPSAWSAQALRLSALCDEDDVHGTRQQQQLGKAYFIVKNHLYLTFYVFPWPIVSEKEETRSFHALNVSQERLSSNMIPFGSQLSRGLEFVRTDGPTRTLQRAYFRNTPVNLPSGKKWHEETHWVKWRSRTR